MLRRPGGRLDLRHQRLPILRQSSVMANGVNSVTGQNVMEMGMQRIFGSIPWYEVTLYQDSRMGH